MTCTISKTSPIGIFDSGFGGMSVAVEMTRLMPNENIIYVGDSAHFPYGPKPLDEVKNYGLKICQWLVDQGVKLIIIACNTSTVATLKAAQEQMPVPVIGVVEPGARASLKRTSNKRIGVLATEGTVKSDAYKLAINNIDADAEVFQVAAPKFVDIAENHIKHVLDEDIDLVTLTNFTQQNYHAAKEYCGPLVDADVDTVIMGCTHFTLLKSYLRIALGKKIILVSSSRETINDAYKILEERNLLNPNNRYYEEAINNHRFYTTGDNIKKYKEFGTTIFGYQLTNVEKL